MGNTHHHQLFSFLLTFTSSTAGLFGWQWIVSRHKFLRNQLTLILAFQFLIEGLSAYASTLGVYGPFNSV
jgi:hypothetical protein